MGDATDNYAASNSILGLAEATAVACASAQLSSFELTGMEEFARRILARLEGDVQAFPAEVSTKKGSA